MDKSSLVLLCHGSRDPSWRAPFDLLRQELIAGGVDDVRIAFLEFSRPTLPEVVEECVRDGVGTIVMQPMFLARARNVVRDVPHLKALIRDRHPELQVEVLPPIGEHPQVILTMADAARSRR